jgi:hypothetical protein
LLLLLSRPSIHELRACRLPASLQSAQSLTSLALETNPSWAFEETSVYIILVQST